MYRLKNTRDFSFAGLPLDGALLAGAAVGGAVSVDAGAGADAGADFADSFAAGFGGNFSSWRTSTKPVE